MSVSCVDKRMLFVNEVWCDFKWETTPDLYSLHAAEPHYPRKDSPALIKTFSRDTRGQPRYLRVTPLPSQDPENAMNAPRRAERQSLAIPRERQALWHVV